MGSARYPVDVHYSHQGPLSNLSASKAGSQATLIMEERQKLVLGHLASNWHMHTMIDDSE